MLGTTEILHSRHRLVVAGVFETSLGEELFLYQARAGEAAERVGASSLVVGATGTSATERLLSDQGSGGLAVYSYIHVNNRLIARLCIYN